MRYDQGETDQASGSGDVHGKHQTQAEGSLAHRGRPRPGEAGVLLLSVDEVARALSLGRSKTYELIAAGELEVVHIGRCARVLVESVEAYVERLRCD